MKKLTGTLILIIAAVAAQAQSPRTSLKIGDKAPDFALFNGDGKLVTLSEYAARGPVVLVFYRGFW